MVGNRGRRQKMAKKIQASEQTSKGLKKQQLLALIVIIVSLFAILLDLGSNESDPNMPIKMLGTLFLILDSYTLRSENSSLTFRQQEGQWFAAGLYPFCDTPFPICFLGDHSVVGYNGKGNWPGGHRCVYGREEIGERP